MHIVRSAASVGAAVKAVDFSFLSRAAAAFGLLAGLGIPSAVMAQGIVVNGVGPVNRSMAGAATACPIDSAGGLYWNPATIGALPASDVSIGCELALPSSRLSSQIDAGALGGGIPPVDLAGSDMGESGVAPIPTFAFVHNPHDSPWSYGLGLFGIGGFTANLPASATNPILTPQPPNGLGLGRVSAQLDILQIVPTLSGRYSERVLVGFAPTVTLARLCARPAFFAAPDDANGDGFATYPDATGTRLHWGAGFQAGIYYIADNDWHLGASVKSPQWFESFRFKSEDELGRPRLLKFSFDYPMIVSVGAAYAGIDDLVFACDLRYFDYGNTQGFCSSGFDSTGAVTGLGWDSVLAVSTGVQRRLSDRLFVRLGYMFNQNPISDAETATNVASALIIQHWLSLGASYRVTENWMFNLTYLHGFENQISGPMKTPAGPIPGTSVAAGGAFDSLSAGITVRF